MASVIYGFRFSAGGIGRPPNAMTSKSTTIVCGTLQSYADRGVFRGFGMKEGRAGKVEFKFLWLTEIPFNLSYDPKLSLLTFRELLPKIPAKSPMYAELKSFVKGRCSDELPDHRRVDAKKAEVKCTNRKGQVSISLKIKKRQYEYGVRKAVHLAGEIFMGFLSGPYYDYMVENFNVSEE